MTERATFDSASAAAKYLGVSLRLLQEHTAAGHVPHVRLGRRVLYVRTQLDRWLEEQATASLRPADQATLRTPGPVRRRRRSVQPATITDDGAA